MNIYQGKAFLKKFQKNEKAILQENKSEQKQKKNKWVIMNAANTVIDLFSKISKILKNAYYYLLL